MSTDFTTLRTAAQEAADLFKAADSDAERNEARALLAEAIEALQDAERAERRRLNAVALLLPAETRTMEGATLDPAAIRRAIADLGLKAPVEIKLSAGTRTGGTHRWRGDRHVVTVTTYANAELVTEVIHHELKHAEQSERLGADAFKRAYRHANGGAGFTRFYHFNPFEVEAREHAAAVASSQPLATQGRSR